MKFLDLFAGIGGFRLGMEAAGHECVGFVEWDKHARKSYEAIHDTEGEWTAHDITKVTDDDLRLLKERGIDVICGGFPCQAFSIAGNRRGFEDTRGTLFFEIARFAKVIRPQYLLLENVKGLLNFNGGEVFQTILYTLDELGYDAEWQVCNSKDFGVPQNRERVFIIGHSRESSRRKIFPIRRNTETLNSKRIEHKQIIIQGMLDVKGKEQTRRVYNPQGIAPTLTTMQGGGQEPKIVVKKIDIPQIVTVRKYKVDKEKLITTLREHKKKVGLTNKEIAEKLAIPITKVEHWFRKDSSFSIPEKEIWINLKKMLEIESNYFDDSIMIFEEKEGVFEKAARHYFSDGLAPTLTSTSAGNEKIILNNDLTELKIRKLTPKECWRLQGFPDSAFEKAEKVNSNSQLYKQAGNSVTVNVIYEIAKKLI